MDESLSLPSLSSSLTLMNPYSRPAPFLGSSLPASLAIRVVFPDSLSPNTRMFRLAGSAEDREVCTSDKTLALENAKLTFLSFSRFSQQIHLLNSHLYIPNLVFFVCTNEKKYILSFACDFWIIHKHKGETLHRHKPIKKVLFHQKVAQFFGLILTKKFTVKRAQKYFFCRIFWQVWLFDT